MHAYTVGAAGDERLPYDDAQPSIRHIILAHLAVQQSYPEQHHLGSRRGVHRWQQLQRADGHIVQPDLQGSAAVVVSGVDPDRGVRRGALQYRDLHGPRGAAPVRLHGCDQEG